MTQIKHPYNPVDRFELDMLTPAQPRRSRATWFVIGLALGALVVAAVVLAVLAVTA